MRKIATLTISVLLASFSAATAQLTSHKAMHRNSGPNTLSKGALNLPKGADLMPKLIGQANYIPVMGTDSIAIVDSFALSYSPGRGSAVDANTLSYYLNSGNFSADMYNAEMVPTNVVYSFPKPFATFDTLLYFGSAAAINAQRADGWEIADYNADDTYRDIAYTNSVYGGLKIDRRQVLQYTSGLLSAVLLLETTATGFDTTTQRFLTRDAAGRIIIDSTVQYSSGIYDNAVIRKFTYNAAGQYVSSVEENAFDPTMNMPGNTYTLTYHSDGCLHTFRNVAPQGRYYVDTFNYTPKVNGYTSFTRTVYGTNGKATGEIYSYTCHINSASLKDTTTYMSVINKDTSYRMQYVIYNTEGLPANIATHARNKTGAHMVNKTFFYYSKDTATSVDEQVGASSISAQPASLVLAPNPTTGTFVLHYAQSIPPTPLQVCIATMSGQLVHSERIVPQGSATSITLGAEATPGMYSVAVYGVGGTPYYKGLLLKQ